MADDIKVYTPAVVAEIAFPLVESTTGTDSSSASSSQGGTYTAKQTPEQPFPIARVASELLSTAINTRSKKILAQFEFTQSGAIQIGKYENGVSGDLRLSPDGIVMRNKSGINTIVFDPDTGDAYFSGRIQSGTVIAGVISVGDDSIQIDGINRRQVWFDPDTQEPVIGIGFL